MLGRKWARLLVESECVQVRPDRPFTYASGLVGPIYCDNRKVPGLPDLREKVVSAFVELIQNNSLQFDLIAGLATAGIPHGMLLAHQLRAPFCYVRSVPKGHGRGQQVEGLFHPGQRALLVEDLVNQGSSLEKAALGARRDGLEIADCLCLVDYQMDSCKQRLKNLGINLYCLTSFDDIADCVRELGQINDEQHEMLKKWHFSPENWP